jgi:hypothetical protein
MRDANIGAYYERSALEEFAKDVLDDSDTGMMVSIERVGILHDELTRQMLREISQYIEKGIVAQFVASPECAMKDRQTMKEGLIAAILLRRRVAGLSNHDLIPMGFGPVKETSC